MKIHDVRLTARASVLALASALVLAGHGSAAAACVAGSAGISFECSGESSNAAAVANTARNPAITGDNGNAAFRLAPGSAFTNSATVSVGFDAAELGSNPTLAGYFRSRLYGISGDQAGRYTILNTAAGAILVSNPGIGRAWGVAGNGDATDVAVTNDGLIAATRGPVTLTQVQSGALNATARAFTPAALDVAAAIYAEEELETLTILNRGTLRASGPLAGAIYTRAGETGITNLGLIETVTPGTGFAIGAVSDSGDLREVEIENKGTIKGDIALVNGSALRWWALSNGLGTGGQGPADRLRINSQFGQLDSEITNSGTIQGNIYLSNGRHELENTASGVLTGTIDVDQRGTVVTNRTCTVGVNGCFASGAAIGFAQRGNPGAEEPSTESAAVITALAGGTATYTLTTWGAKDFSFENRGRFDGNLTVTTEAAGKVGGFDTRASRFTFEPRLGVSGEGSSFNAPRLASGAINGTLKVWDGTKSTVADTMTVEPFIDVGVHSGEFFAIAATLHGTELPKVVSTPLVSWAPGRNASGALVLGATVKDARSIAGIGANGAAAVNALMASDHYATDRLSGAIQNLDDEEDVAEVADSLAPNTEGADIELAFGATEGMRDVLAARLSRMESEPREQGDAGDDAAGSGLWIAPFGSYVTEDEYKALTGGLVAGIEGPLDEGLTLGAAIAFGRGETRAWTEADVDVTTAAIAAYGSAEVDGFLFGGSIGLAHNSFDRTRVVDLPGGALVAKGSNDGIQLFGDTSVSYAIDLRNGVTVSPVASLAVGTLWQEAYRESGPAGIPLLVLGQNTLSVQSGLGVEVEIPIHMEAFELSLNLEATWKHQFADTRAAVTAAFDGSPTFAAVGDAEGRDTAEIGAALELALTSGVSASAAYEMEIGKSGIAEQQGMLKVGVSF